jgi:DNA processing protein
VKPLGQGQPTLTPELAAATLIQLPKMSPPRLRALVDHFGDPRAAFDAVLDGFAADALTPGPPGSAAERRRWQLAVLWRDRADPASMARRLSKRGTEVWLDGGPSYPITEPVPDRPVALLAEGCRPDVLSGPRVAVVGTRSATPHGLADARELGAFLAGANVTVVSGMAIGIDGAAHDGALGAGGAVAGVIATGLDIEYPRRHTTLYDRVRRSGIVLGESAFGTRPDPGRFPVRNRIIAALADIVVVIEATIKGGARITAQYALDYGRTVMAVPGSRRNIAAEGTNALIADGAHPLTDWSDVLIGLGLSAATIRRGAPSRPAPGADGAALLRALGGEAASADQLASRAGLPPDRVACALAELERSGWVERAQGAVWPR